MCLDEKKAALDAMEAKAVEEEPGYQALLAEAMAFEKPEIPLGWGLGVSKYDLAYFIRDFFGGLVN